MAPRTVHVTTIIIIIQHILVSLSEQRKTRSMLAIVQQFVVRWSICFELLALISAVLTPNNATDLLGNHVPEVL